MGGPIDDRIAPCVCGPWADESRDCAFYENNSCFCSFRLMSYRECIKKCAMHASVPEYSYDIENLLPRGNDKKNN